jgi:D-serine deaminase-like pyridoxal phosphate-dependent protein
LNLNQIETPALVLDRAKLDANVSRLRSRLQGRDVVFRPHMKTAKSIEVAHLVMTTPAGPATVSTLQEAAWLAGHGVVDILYAVGIAPHRLDRVVALRKSGVDLTVILDSEVQARAVAAKSRAAGLAIPALIEIDSDGHRGGVKPDDPALLRIGRILKDGGAELQGVMTHAGGSYDCATTGAIIQIAEQERRAAVSAADALKSAGLPSPVVSVGSTPTALFAESFAGVTEVRAGVFMFFDLVMAGLGVCAPRDIAISVLTTVIGHQPDRGWILIDAGWMALSRDRGTAGQPVDQSYGLVCDVHGEPIPDLVVAQANQEHGIIVLRPGSQAALPDLPIGARLRILPNHACATAAQHEAYEVVDSADLEIEATWPRVRGW